MTTQRCRSVTPVAAAQRDPWLDNVKMALVILVVIGHAIGLVEASQGSHWVYDFIYLWHIPAFVFVSGYLSKSFAWDRRRMKSLVYTLAIPYLLFEPALFYYRREVVGENVTGPLWLEPHWTMWYLIVLLMWRLVTPILKLHWLFLPLSVIVSLARGPLGHRRTDDPALPRPAAVLRARPARQAPAPPPPRRRLGPARSGPDARRHRHHGGLHRHVGRDRTALVRHRLQRDPDRQRDRLPDQARRS